MKKYALIVVVVGLLVAAVPALAQTQTNEVYVVQEGDTLGEISQRFNVSIASLISLNNIQNVNRILIGQQLTIRTTGGTGGPVTPQPQPGVGEYIVQPGDNLFRIAQAARVTLTALAEANDISDINRVFAGQVLTIPAGGVVPQPGAGTPPPATGGPVVPQPTEYTVRPGDFLRAIANRFDVTVDDILDANTIANPNVIFPGEVLTIPASSTENSG